MFIKIYPNEIYLCYDCYKINLLCVILWFKKSNQEDPLSNLHLKLARWSRGEYSNWKCDKIGFWIQYRLNIWLKWRSLIDILIRNKIYLCIVCLGRFNGAPSIFQLRIMFWFYNFCNHLKSHWFPHPNLNRIRHSSSLVCWPHFPIDYWMWLNY